MLRIVNLKVKFRQNHTKNALLKKDELSSYRKCLSRVAKLFQPYATFVGRRSVRRPAVNHNNDAESQHKSLLLIAIVFSEQTKLSLVI